MSKVLGMSNGKVIDPYDFKPARDFYKNCVAKSLSNICRYNGHLGWISVAEHCLIVKQIMELRHAETYTGNESADDWALLGLLHDSFESVIGDIVTPVKHHPMFAALRRMEDDALTQIFRMHGLCLSSDAATNLQAADRYAMSVEVEHLGYYGKPEWYHHTVMYPADRYPEVIALGVRNKDAEWLWLEAYNKIQERRNYGKIARQGKTE
jgi:hypothetical protein